ncbi:uncharacterized protein DDB_G0290685-like [Anoplopoma fimbria]|uniref:uncharacterized protein DDB_G0290685-like n=1 Tax=Anoplopoma fimbria TaxID=229290 RepID=UPI0023EC28FB|nr:uncharacterized protein DDB_G0290685-like [Anoplopoma fimbria]
MSLTANMRKHCTMPHRTDGLACKYQLSVLSTLIFHHAVAFLLLTHSHGGQARTTGQPQPTLATVGDDITLPCHVTAATDAINQMLEWSRPDLNPRFVHVRRSSEDRLVDQNPSYKGRTSVSIDGLKQGDASLTLSRVRVSDEGTYRCFIPELKTQADVQLVVVSSTVIKMTKVSSGVLQCESRGWYPEPEVLWLDAEGNLLSAGPTETVRGPDDLYTVSSRVTVEKRHSNSFTCRVQQKNTNQTRETHITVPDDFFSGSSGSRLSSSASTVIGLFVGFMFALAVAFFVWKWRQNKIKNKRHHDDEETKRGGEKKSESINNSEQELLIERESDNRELPTEEREAKGNQDNDEKHHIDCLSKVTGCSCQNTEETLQEKAGGDTNDILTDLKKDRTEGETMKDLDETEKETKSMNEETPTPGPAEKDTPQKPEDTNTETGAPGQMDRDGQQQLFGEGRGIKPGGQGPTDGEKNSLDQTGGLTEKNKTTHLQHLVDGKTNQLPEELNDLNKKDEDKDTESIINERTGQDVTQKDELEKGGGRKAVDQGSTDGENKDLDQNGKKTEKNDATPLPTEKEGQHLVDGKTNQLPEELNDLNKKDEDKETESNKKLAGQDVRDGDTQKYDVPSEKKGQHEENGERRDGALSLTDGKTSQLSEELNDLNKKDGVGETESTINEQAGDNPRERETQRDAVQEGGGRKAVDQGPTDGENKDLDQNGEKTEKNDATPLPTEKEGQHLVDGKTNQLPEELNDLNKKDKDKETESIINERTGQDVRDGVTQKDELEKGGGRKAVDQGPTDGENKDLDQNGEKTEKNDSRDEARDNEETDQVPKVLNDMKKKYEDAKEESTINTPAGKNAREGETQRDKIQPRGETDTEEDNNVVISETKPPCSQKTETNTEQPETSPESIDGQKDMTSINDDGSQTDKPTAREKKDVEKTGLPSETEVETNGTQPQNQDGKKDMTYKKMDIRQMDKPSADAENDVENAEEEKETKAEEQRMKTVLAREPEVETNGTQPQKPDGEKDMSSIKGEIIQTDKP